METNNEVIKSLDDIRSNVEKTVTYSKEILLNLKRDNSMRLFKVNIVHIVLFAIFVAFISLYVYENYVKFKPYL